MKIDMRLGAKVARLGIAVLLAMAASGVCRAQSAVELPNGVKAVWDLAKAYRETTPKRERISINGLWRWQPATERDGLCAGRQLGLLQGPRAVAGA